MDPKFSKIAESELRETESRRTQAIQQLNDWLDKHPFIKKVRRDDIFLGGFLRYDKYNVDKACQRIENLFILPVKYPNYYLIEDSQKLLKANLALVDAGFMYSLPERDELGRLVFICKFGVRDPDVFSVPDVFRLFRSAIMTWAIKQETQIAGCIMVFDMADVGLKHLYSPQDIRATMDIIKNVAALRQKGYVILNLNKFASSMIDIFKTVISDKMRSRLHIVGTNDDINNYVKPKSILPKEYNGGSMTEQEMIGQFKQLLIQHHDEATDIFNSEIDVTKIPASKLQLEEGDVTGSFRTLEID